MKRPGEGDGNGREDGENWRNGEEERRSLVGRATRSRFIYKSTSLGSLRILFASLPGYLFLPVPSFSLLLLLHSPRRRCICCAFSLLRLRLGRFHRFHRAPFRSG